MEFDIEGMICDGCVRAIQRVVRVVPGVASAVAGVVAAAERAGYKTR